MSLNKLQEMVKDREACVLQFMGSQRVGHYLVTEQNKASRVGSRGKCLEVGLSGGDMDMLYLFPILCLMCFFHLALPELYHFFFSKYLYLRFFVSFLIEV